MLKTELTVAKRFLSARYSGEYVGELLVDGAPQLSQLIDACVRFALPFAERDTVIKNIKGRDPGNNLIAGTMHQASTAEELFFVSGILTSSRYKDQASAFDIGRPHRDDSYAVHVQSAFLDFPTSGSIRHRVSTARTGSLPSCIPVSLLGRIIPVQPNFIRLGIEIFEPRFLTFSLGNAPIVTQTLWLDADATHCRFKLSDENMPDRTTPPGSRSALFDRLAHVVREVWQQDLGQDYLSKLR